MKKWFRWIGLGALAGLLIFVGVAFLRMKLAAGEVQREAQTYANTTRLAIGETDTLEVIPLYEKAAQTPDLISGHGVSYLVRTDTTNILFDLGNNLTAASPSPLELNMAALGITLDDIDIVVISHRHLDHVGGQNWWTAMTFSLDGAAQPELGSRPIYIPEVMTYPGSSPILSDAPVRLTDGVATTGLITYAQPFPLWLATPKGDEQALAVNVRGQGIVLITGCGHMGLDALLKRAEAVFEAPITGVLGGLHYGTASAQDLQPQIELLQALNPTVVGLSPHDSGPAALDAFAQTFGEAYQPIAVGQAIRVP